MVIIPTILDSVERARDLVAHVEVQALGNLDPHIHFAILSDFKDAAQEMLPRDAEILAAAADGIAALNAKHGNGDPNRFFLFHRLRQWNEREGLWMGWERKRGKIEEFNRLLRGATDTSFVPTVGDPAILPQVRYCITLDSDTRLPRDAARTLIGIISHPLNRPSYDPAVGRVTEGYGILQPRVSVTFTSAAGSLFARLYAGHTGVDPYTTAVSDTYQDLFGEGSFTGRASTTSTRLPPPSKTWCRKTPAVARPVRGLHARVALVSDVELVDEYPSSVLARTPPAPVDPRRLADLRGCSRSSRRGRDQAQLVPVDLALEDPRQPAPQPRRLMLLALLVAGWIALPGRTGSGPRRCSW
jgi:cyclic beta-1,2-glucan synthetase